MSEARERVLASIRAALGERPSVAAPPPVPPPVPAPTLEAPLSADQLVALFIERLRDYGASVTTCEPAAVSAALLEACERHAARRLVIPPGLPENWRPHEIELIIDESLSPEQLDGLDGVITGAAVGIAQSGTIALDGAADQGRRALTLIPDLHLCVVEAGRVVAALPEALEVLSPSIRSDRRPITMISGPSATADIELRRVQGVHGPRRLEVVIPSG